MSNSTAEKSHFFQKKLIRHSNMRCSNTPCFSKRWSADLLTESAFLVLMCSAWISSPIWDNTFRLWYFEHHWSLRLSFFFTVFRPKKPWQKNRGSWKHKCSFLSCSKIFHFNDIQKYLECITADKCRNEVQNTTENRPYLYARHTNMLKYVVKYAVGVK